MLTPLKIGILAFCASCGIAGCIVGCAVSNNWWPMFGMIFLLFGIFMLVAFGAKYDPDSSGLHVYWLLYVGTCLLFSTVGYVIVLFVENHKHSVGNFVPNLLGYLVMIGTLFLYIFLDSKQESSNDVPYFQSF